MDDPVARMARFVAAEQGRVAHEQAERIWSARVPHLLPAVEHVVAAFCSGLTETGWTARVRADSLRAQFPLAITFEWQQPDDSNQHEIGASAQFRCKPDGIVYGVRFPFHSASSSIRPETFVDLGEPGTVSAHELGHAVADFLEWAAVGKGCGRRKLHFTIASRQDSVEATPMSLRIAA